MKGDSPEVSDDTSMYNPQARYIYIFSGKTNFDKL